MTEKKLAGKIAAASMKVGGAIAADKRNQEQRYDYVSADAILSIGGQALAEQGITVWPSIIDQTIDVVERGNGKARYDALVHFAMIVADGAEQIELPWYGRGSDYTVPDKAMYKAITSGHRYFLGKLLNIGMGNEDGEHESGGEVRLTPGARAEDTRPAQQAPRQRQLQRSAPEPPPVSAEEEWDNIPAYQEGNAEPVQASKPAMPAALRKKFHSLGVEFYGDGWDTKRRELVKAMTTGQTENSNDLTEAEMRRLIAGMEKVKAGKQPVNNGTA